MFCFCFIGLAFCGFAQKNNSTIQEFLNKNAEKLGLKKADVSAWVVTDEYYSQSTKITHVHIQQQHGGINVFNAVANHYEILSSSLLWYSIGLLFGIIAKFRGTWLWKV